MGKVPLIVNQFLANTQSKENVINLIIKLLSITFIQKPRQIYLWLKFVNIIRCRFQSL
jgi:hypothetical protein